MPGHKTQQPKDTFTLYSVDMEWKKGKQVLFIKRHAAKATAENVLIERYPGSTYRERCSKQLVKDCGYGATPVEAVELYIKHRDADIKRARADMNDATKERGKARTFLRTLKKK